ncbi:hypothetical protein Btru_032723 [Bulinus truncatus]|nr:hypothetical protein Btru_032723 [Bulinus truncatus]
MIPADDLCCLPEGRSRFFDLPLNDQSRVKYISQWNRAPQIGLISDLEVQLSVLRRRRSESICTLEDWMIKLMETHPVTYQDLKCYHDRCMREVRTQEDERFGLRRCLYSLNCTLTDRLFCSSCHRRVNFKTMKENGSKKKMSNFDSGRAFSISHPHHRPWSSLEEETKERGMEQPKRFWQLTKRLETLRSLNLCSADIEPKKNKARNIYEMKKCLSDLTCLLTDDVPGGGILNYRSGRVADVIQYKEKDMKKCACAACSLSECPKDKWWNVRVHTCSSRNHNPGNVKLTLFYDHVDSHVTTLQNGSTLFENRKRDISWIDFPTCDQQLATLLGKMVDSFNALSGELTMKYRDREGGNNLVIIVSHPFGLPKFVSIGRLIEESHGQEKNPKRYKYTNPTFPGTDGAHVFVLGQ